MAVGPAEELRARYPGEQVAPVPRLCSPARLGQHAHPSGVLGLPRFRPAVRFRGVDAAPAPGPAEARPGGLRGLGPVGRPRMRAERGDLHRRHVVRGLDDGARSRRSRAARPRLPGGLRPGRRRTARDHGAAGGATGRTAARMPGPQVEAGLSPHAPYTVSARLYREVARYGRRHGLRLATHVAESPAEVELLERGTGAIAQAYRAAHMWKGRRWKPPGVSPVAYLAETGYWGRRRWPSTACRSTTQTSPRWRRAARRWPTAPARTCGCSAARPRWRSC